jgi:hypothetical protein
MEIKDKEGNVIGFVKLNEGYNIKDIIGAFSKAKNSLKNLVSIDESANKKQILFKFENGEIFYDLPSKTFVRSNGVVISKNSFRGIVLNVKNSLVSYEHKGSVDNFWLVLAEKTNVNWIKTFFKIIDIWANNKYTHYRVDAKVRNLRNKIEILISDKNRDDKKFFDNIEIFAKLPKIQAMDENQLINLYKGLSKNKLSINAFQVSFDKWILDNFAERVSNNYVESEETLVNYAGDYLLCHSGGLKDAFRYCFDNYKGVIVKKHIEHIKKLIGFGYEYKRLIDYLYRDIYNQGLELTFDEYGYSDNTIEMLSDYASMNVDMKTAYDKYPRYLATMHDIAQKNYEIREDEILNEKFKKIVKNLKNKKLEYSNDDYVIVLPKSGKDLTKEGQSLSHCVASYYKRMALGETNVLFLRKKNSIDESLVTIELNNMYEIVQAKGKNNSSPKEPEKEFVDSYAKYLLGLKKG